MIGSANHDESVFPDPEKFDISRVPHGHFHIGFGHGIHFCLGAPLARLEGSIVLKIILDRLQDLELDDRKKETIKQLPSFVFIYRSYSGNKGLKFRIGDLYTQLSPQSMPID